MKIVEINNLNKVYKERDIFKKFKKNNVEKKGIFDISFHVEEGEIFSIIGLNGAGKTTIMKCLLGLIDYDKGEIDVFQNGNLNKKYRKDIGYLPEISYYPKSIKLGILLEYYAELLELPNKYKSIEEALDRVGLVGLKNSRLEEFSKGMLQKVGIAQSILNKPKLLCLDEPMSGLDPVARGEVIELLKDMKKQGTTIFLNTHILNDIEKIGDRGIIIHKGKIIDKFDLQKIKSNEKYMIYYSDGTVEEAINFNIKNNGNNIIKIEKKEFSLESYFRKIIGV